MKTCLIAVPLDEKDSEKRRRLDQVIDSLLVPALKACGYATPPDRTDRLWTPNWEPQGVRLVPKVVLEAVMNADLVIADLTGGYGDVRDQLAFRHGARRPSLQIVQRGVAIPEYLSKYQTVFYDHFDQFDHNDAGAAEQARREIIQEIVAQIKQEEGGSNQKRSPIIVARASSLLPEKKG